MPEGDTIFRTASVLRAALVGRRVVNARAQAGPGLRRVPDLSRVLGSVVTSVEARGKHLLIGFDNGLTLRSHMRMRGSWHRYRPGEAWRLPRSQANAILETPEAVAVAFNTPTVELLTDADLRRSRQLRELGPDLLGETFDSDEAVRRLRERDGDELGEALLDQRAVAGIGNVVKSEVCFVERLDPWALVRLFDDAELESALVTARRLLQRERRWRRAGDDRDARARTRAVGLRSSRASLPTMRDAHRDAAPRRAGAVDVLVSAVPAQSFDSSERRR